MWLGRRGGAAVPFAWAAAALSSGCGESYPLPPTPCDEYCFAAQRAACDEDDPADCVGKCEITDGQASRRCGDAWHARNDCLLHADTQQFICVDDRTRVPPICLDERLALSECLAPGSTACFQQCARKAELCGDALVDCEASCAHPSAACRHVGIAYDECLLGYPVECREAFAPDPRAPSDIPCFDEALAVLACANF